MTEGQVERSFRKIVIGPSVDAKVLDKAGELLDELRPESPLRHRLSTELDELRELCLSKR